MRRKLRDLILAFVLGSFVVLPAYALDIDLDHVQPSLGEPVTSNDFTAFFEQYKGLCLFFSGVCTVTALIMFVLALTKLSLSANNDMERRKAIRGIFWTGCSLALFGGITVVVGVAWNIF